MEANSMKPGSAEYMYTLIKSPVLDCGHLSAESKQEKGLFPSRLGFFHTTGPGIRISYIKTKKLCSDCLLKAVPDGFNFWSMLVPASDPDQSSHGSLAAQGLEAHPSSDHYPPLYQAGTKKTSKPLTIPIPHVPQAKAAWLWLQEEQKPFFIDELHHMEASTPSARKRVEKDAKIANKHGTSFERRQPLKPISRFSVMQPTTMNHQALHTAAFPAKPVDQPEPLGQINASIERLGQDIPALVERKPLPSTAPAPRPSTILAEGSTQADNRSRRNALYLPGGSTELDAFSTRVPPMNTQVVATPVQQQLETPQNSMFRRQNEIINQIRPSASTSSMRPIGGSLATLHHEKDPQVATPSQSLLLSKRLLAKEPQNRSTMAASRPALYTRNWSQHNMTHFDAMAPSLAQGSTANKPTALATSGLLQSSHTREGVLKRDQPNERTVAQARRGFQVDGRVNALPASLQVARKPEPAKKTNSSVPVRTPGPSSDKNKSKPYDSGKMPTKPLGSASNSNHDGRGLKQHYEPWSGQKPVSNHQDHQSRNGYKITNPFNNPFFQKIAETKRTHDESKRENGNVASTHHTGRPIPSSHNTSGGQAVSQTSHPIAPKHLHTANQGTVDGSSSYSSDHSYSVSTHYGGGGWGSVFVQEAPVWTTQPDGDWCATSEGQSSLDEDESTDETTDSESEDSDNSDDSDSDEEGDINPHFNQGGDYDDCGAVGENNFSLCGSTDNAYGGYDDSNFGADHNGINQTSGMGQVVSEPESDEDDSDEDDSDEDDSDEDDSDEDGSNEDDPDVDECEEQDFDEENLNKDECEEQDSDEEDSDEEGYDQEQYAQGQTYDDQHFHQYQNYYEQGPDGEGSDGGDYESDENYDEEGDQYDYDYDSDGGY